jgi:hypothetical protein
MHLFQENASLGLLDLHARKGLLEARLLFRYLTIQPHGLVLAQRKEPVALAGPSGHLEKPLADEGWT